MAGFVPQHDANDALFFGGKKKDGKTGFRVRNMKRSNSINLVILQSWDVLADSKHPLLKAEESHSASYR